jgi:hypothetical protein
MGTGFVFGYQLVLFLALFISRRFLSGIKYLGGDPEL